MKYPIFHKLLSNYGEVVPEYRFHPTRKWRFDYAFPDKMIAVEVEGLVYRGKSRHTNNSGYKGDLEKYNAAACLGWLVLRFSQDMLAKSSTFDTISSAFTLRESQQFIRLGSDK